MQKTVLITGCSSGFGRSTALLLARKGWHVFATVRKESDRESVLREAESCNCQDAITVLLCDIVKSEQIAALFEQVKASLETISSDNEAIATPHLDALVNNAGTAYAGPIEIQPLDDIRAQFELNFFAQIAMIQTFLPLIKNARGTIINVSSISGRISTPLTGVYSSSKYALEAVSDALRIEVAHFNVHVVLVEPGSSPTSIWNTSFERSMQHIQSHELREAYAPLLRFGERYERRSEKHGFPAQLFASRIEHILTVTHPRARYGVPTSTTILMLLRRFLPDAWWDGLARLFLRW
jgi:NAD(P)-dependent dehydrogenase (short-subunit alcohol dehydrogenase family)